jgi:hypothetical protein
MPLPTPHLDDRDFATLVDDARQLIAARCPQWTDLSAGDPGMVLVELFAYLTDMMLYRLNRVPEKAYIAFLDLIGVRLQPPTAATVTLDVSADAKTRQPLTLPRGSRVTVGSRSSGREDPVFVTMSEVVVPAGGVEQVTAVHCETVDAELVGHGTGGPGLTLQVRRPPVLHRSPDGLELVVAVEATPAELESREPAVTHNGRPYRVWREVNGFASVGGDPFVYVADRVAGTIMFAPEVRGVTEVGLDPTARPLAAVPLQGREIRVWYRRGGGANGNLAAGALTVLKNRQPGLSVVNRTPATGGRDTESLENALRRGPQQLHAVRRAVTARDIELIALSSSGAVARARAFTAVELWRHAVPGSVEVLLVPSAPLDERAGISAPAMESLHTADALDVVKSELDARSPMGTTRRLGWSRYKTVRVRTRVVVHRTENLDAARSRLIDRLRRTINPLGADSNSSGWAFGEPLRASHIYDTLLAERGVRYVDRLRLVVDEVPGDVHTVATDFHQQHTWYCGSGEILFRSLDNGEGWEQSGRFEGERVERIHPSRSRPGLVVAATRVGHDERSRLRVSFDCGESWDDAAELDFHVEDLTVVRRDDEWLALLATDRGLYELPLRQGAVPVQILVDRSRPDLGFYAVAAITSDQGDLLVAVAAQEKGGVAMSTQGGRPGTFQQLGALTGKDIRTLTVREEGPRRFLLAGVTAAGTEPGEGAYMIEVVGVQVSPQGWQPLTAGWAAGSCNALAMQGRTVLAASHALGVVRFDLSASKPAWRPAGVDSGLAMRDPGRFAPLTTIVTGPDARTLMVGV